MRNSLWLLLTLAPLACARDPITLLQEIRHLPETAMHDKFSQLSLNDKRALFFAANRRHPPYSGLHGEMAQAEVAFFVSVRADIDTRGGVPEVLSYLNILQIAAQSRLFQPEDVAAFRIDSVCELAKASDYCPKLARRVAELMRLPRVEN